MVVTKTEVTVIPANIWCRLESGKWGKPSLVMVSDEMGISYVYLHDGKIYLTKSIKTAQFTSIEEAESFANLHRDFIKKNYGELMRNGSISVEVTQTCL